MFGQGQKDLGSSVKDDMVYSPNEQYSAWICGGTLSIGQSMLVIVVPSIH